MSQGNDVTYADLNFGKPPPEKALQEGRKGWTRKIALGAVATSLFLLATTVGLGVRYWQVSGQLQRASQGHTARSAALAKRIGSQEEILDRMKGQLREAEGGLSSTREALRKSQEAAQKIQQQLQAMEEALREANHNLEALKQENKEKEALLQQKDGFCPPGWTLFRWKCFWISTETKSWWRSQEDCSWKSSQLAILKKPWDTREFWDAVIIQNSPQNSEYWIGLWSREKSTDVFLWADGSRYEGTEKFYKNSYYEYIKISRGSLAQSWSYNEQHRYICEVAASSVALPEPNLHNTR